MNIKILSSAEHDLINGHRFYEAQDSGLGNYFLDTLYSDIDSLHLFAGIHQLVHSDSYRMLSKRFPFAIYYSVENSVAIVHAVLDCRRSPAWLRSRLKSPVH